MLTGGVGVNFSYRDWYQGVIQTKKPYLSEVYKRTAAPQLNVATLAIPLFDQDQKLRAILAIQLNLASVLDWSNGFQVDQGGSVYIIDQKGQIATGPKLSLTGPITSLAQMTRVQDLTRGEMGIVSDFYNPIEQDKFVAALVPVPDYHWGVIVQQQAKYAFALDSISRIFRNGIIVLASAFLLSLFYIGFRRRQSS